MRIQKRPVIRRANDEYVRIHDDEHARKNITCLVFFDVKKHWLGSDRIDKWQNGRI